MARVAIRTLSLSDDYEWLSAVRRVATDVVEADRADVLVAIEHADAFDPEAIKSMLREAVQIGQGRSLFVACVGLYDEDIDPFDVESQPIFFRFPGRREYVRAESVRDLEAALEAHLRRLAGDEEVATSMPQVPEGYL